MCSCFSSTCRGDGVTSQKDVGVASKRNVGGTSKRADSVTSKGENSVTSKRCTALKAAEEWCEACTPLLPHGCHSAGPARTASALGWCLQALAPTCTPCLHESSHKSRAKQAQQGSMEMTERHTRCAHLLLVLVVIPRVIGQLLLLEHNNFLWYEGQLAGL